MAKTKKTAAAPSPQESFAALVAKYKDLPKDDPNAFKGTDPDGKASNFQKDMLTKMGITFSEKSTKLDAHASIKAFAEIYPEKSAELWAAQKAAVDAKKAETKAAEPKEAKPAEGKKYTVTKAQVNEPATYHQMIQLNETGIRKFSDTSPIPTKGEVADKLNALQASDKAAYDKGMSVANDKVAKWKHQEPSAAQKAFAESIGIKVSPFTPADKAPDGKQKGSTAFSVGEKIHDFKVKEPEKYADAKAASDAKYAAAKAEKEGKVDPDARLDAKLNAAVAAKTASTAAKTGAAPTQLVIPETTVQAEGLQAGE